MQEAAQDIRERALLRVGAVCAILGSVVSVAAGTGFGNRTVGADSGTVLRFIAARPDWYWPTVYLGFILGAFLWVGAFVALASSLTQGISWALGQLGVASIIIGATLHIIDASINGFGLAALARAWAAAPAPEQANLLRDAGLLLRILGGTWASVISFFHGLPFILLGLAVVLSHRYPAWLGWVGVGGGLGSLVLGVTMFLGTPGMIYVVFAIVVSVWMVAMGILMWQCAGRAPIAEALQYENYEGLRVPSGQHEAR